jgi:polyisoprenoid-binding protein YceI
MLLACAWLAAAATPTLGQNAPAQTAAENAIDQNVIDQNAIDQSRTRIGFTLKTRWGQTLQGRFPQYSGEIERMGDGRRRVRLRMSTRSVEIIGHPNYSEFTRGKGFFEADRFPEMEFVSEPYDNDLLREGGRLSGQLRIRDVTRRESFQVLPADCPRPAYDCDVVASGSVRRSDFGVDRWLLAVSDIVRFRLRLRLQAQKDGA